MTTNERDRRPWVKLSIDYFRNFKIMRLTNDAKIWSVPDKMDIGLCREFEDVSKS